MLFSMKAISEHCRWCCTDGWRKFDEGTWVIGVIVGNPILLPSERIGRSVGDGIGLHVLSLSANDVHPVPGNLARK
jgi:hypothetical protein